MPPQEKRPLMTGEFAWFITRQSAKMGAIIGPDPLVDITDEDIWLKPDPEDEMGVIIAGGPLEAVQDFCTLGPNEYAVIYNPVKSRTSGSPNGSFTSKRTDVPEIVRGKKCVVASGSFPTWPGQKVEVRNIHRLSTSEYLVAVVESADVDTSAPYYNLTVQCAQIRKAVVDETVASKDEGHPETPPPGSDGTSLDKQSTGDGPGKDTQTSQPEPSASGSDKPSEGQIVFTVGQRIIIPGNKTPIYIPPSGIEVLFETEDMNSQPDKKPLTDEEIVVDRIAKGVLKIENLREWLAAASLSEDHYTYVEQDYVAARKKGESDTALIQGINRQLERSSYSRLAQALRQAAVKPAQNDTAIQQAVVLGPTQFCVVLDEDGKPQTNQGPGRVFPGPWDRFRTEGSDDRIYQAYHLRTDRGILLRVVADISKDELQNQLPQGAELDVAKQNYVKGDEIFIGGFDAYFVPSSAIEVINPRTRQPHIGNKHSDAYVTAIGVDQKSGVYVANVETGNVDLVKGEKKLLLDPRKQQHQFRRVPAEVWNLIIGRGEPHKQAVVGKMVETPWAFSIMVPNNEAILVISKDGRRAFVGPGTTLLHYEEILEILTLSRGKTKSDADQLSTCFLRVTGNRISDTVQLETSDFVKLDVAVQYGVTFVGDTDEEQVKWFNHKDYVMLLAENMRSRLRAAARQKKLTDLYPIVSDFIRDTVLGIKPEEEGQHRPGHLFEENNMMVTEVEVLSANPDVQVARSLEEANRKIVTLEILGKSEQASLEAERRKDAIDTERARLGLAEIARSEKIRREEALAEARLEEESRERGRIERQKEREFAEATQKANEDLLTLLADVRRQRETENFKSEAEIQEARQKLAGEFRDRLAAITKDLLDAAAKADKMRFESIQPSLVEAIEGLGDKQVLTQLSATLPAASGSLGMLLGLGGMQGLIKMLGDSPFGKALASVCQDLATVEHENDREAKSAPGSE